MADAKKTPVNSPLKINAFLTPMAMLLRKDDPTMRYVGAGLYTGSEACLGRFGNLDISTEEGKTEKITRVLLVGHTEKAEDVCIPHGTTVKYVRLEPNVDPVMSGHLSQAHRFLDESKTLNKPTLICGGYGSVRAPFIAATYRMLSEGKLYVQTRDNMLQHLRDSGHGADYFQHPSQFQRCAVLLEHVRTVHYSEIADDNFKLGLYREYKALLKSDIEAALQKDDAKARDPGQ